MKIAVSADLPLALFPEIEEPVRYEAGLKRKFLLKCASVDSNASTVLVDDSHNDADIRLIVRQKKKYAARVLFSANRDDLVAYTTLYDDIFDIHPVDSLSFRPVDFVVDDSYSWFVFTSKRAVDFFFDRVPVCFICTRKIAAVGERTADRLKEKGVRVDYVPDEFYGDSLISFLKDKKSIAVISPLKHNKRFDELKNAKVIPVYENVVPEWIHHYEPEGVFDFGLFTSPSAFWHMKEAFGNFEFARRIKRIIAIGKTTKNYINSCGFDAEMPKRATIGDMFEYIKEQL